jgi:hypothetical protein
MKIRRRVSPDNGAFAFPCSPDASPCDAPAIWAPELAIIAILNVSQAVALSPDLPAGWPPIIVLADHRAADGRHLVITRHGVRHRLWLRPTAEAGQAFHLPDDATFTGRLEAIVRLRSSLAQPPATPPIAHGLTDFQAHRLATLLLVLDTSAAGGTLRDIGAQIYPHIRNASAAEWKGASARRQVQRLLVEARAMRDGGYQRLLTS